VLVVNFWATWCPPCKEEMPEFSRLNTKYAPNGVQFVGISLDSADKVAAFKEETEISYPLLIGNLETLDLSSDLGNRAKALPLPSSSAGRQPAAGQARKIRHCRSGKGPTGSPSAALILSVTTVILDNLRRFPANLQT
jgi:thiol-disulfide isomerase/thioredoxin